MSSARRIVAAAAAALISTGARAAAAVAPTSADSVPTAGAVVPGAVADTPAPAVDEIVALALQRTPAIAALRERRAAAAARVALVNALPDPTLEVALQDVGFPDYTVGEEEMSMLGVELRQDLQFFGKRGARKAAAQAEAEQDAAEIVALERRVTSEVRSLYARLYALDRRRAAVAAARELTQLLAATAAARTGTGQGEWESQVKAQLASTRLDERMDDLLAERAALVATLDRYLDRPAATPFGEVSELPETAPPDAAYAAQAVAHAPEVAARRSAVVAAERRLTAERRDVAPNLYAAAAYAGRGALDPVVTFRVGAELPLWRRGKAVGVGEHEVALARHELRDAEAIARAEAARLAAAWRNADAQVRRYREAILPQTSAAIDAARSSYIAGQADFSTLVEDYNLWLEAREQLAEREAERFMHWSDLDVLVATAPAAEGSRP